MRGVPEWDVTDDKFPYAWDLWRGAYIGNKKSFADLPVQEQYARLILFCEEESTYTISAGTFTATCIDQRILNVLNDAKSLVKRKLREHITEEDFRKAEEMAAQIS